MERYLSAAERIAGWALATDNLPAKPLEIGYLAREQRIRRTDRSTIEAEHRVEFAGEYIVRFGLPGERPPIDGFEAAPVTLGFWMDGKLLATQIGRDEAVGTRVLQSVFRRRVPAVSARRRSRLPRGIHRRWVREDAASERGVQPAEEQVPRLDHLHRTVCRRRPRKRRRKKILTCDPESGRACVETILTNLARRAYRRPPTRARGRFAGALRRSREGQRPVDRAGPAARHPGDAGLAEFPVPHRARSRSAQSRARARGVAVRARVARQLFPVELDAGRRTAGAGRVRQAARPARARSPGESDARRPARVGLRRELRRPVARDAQPRRREAGSRTSSRNGIPSCARR